MMFRSAHADEDSSSDWDDYSPAPSPKPPESTGASSTNSPLLQSSATTTTAALHPSTRTRNVTARHSHSPHKSVQIQQPASVISYSGPRDHVIRPLETELTELSTVSPPRTPAAFATHAPSAAAYRTALLSEEANEGENPINQGQSDVIEAIPNVDGGGCCVARPRLDAERALEFTVVSSQSADVISPSFDPSYSYMAAMAEKSDECAKRCSEEIFSTLRVGSNFVIAFLLGFINYLLHSVIRKLLCGLLLICLDSIYKPLVQICFNGCCWPLLSLSSQLSKGCVVVLTPLLDLLGRVIVMVTNCVAACRLVQVNNNHKHYSTTA